MATELGSVERAPEKSSRKAAGTALAKKASRLLSLVRLFLLGPRTVGLVPVHYAFFFTYALGPGIKYDLGAFLLPYVAWIGVRFGRKGMIVFAVATLPPGLFNYAVGPWHIGIGLAEYFAALVVGFLFALPGDLRVRIKAVFGRPVLWWLKRPYWALLLVGVTLEIQSVGFGISYYPIHLALVSAFLLGLWLPTVRISTETVHVRQVLTFIVASFLINIFMARFPINELVQLFLPSSVVYTYFYIAMALDGIWPLLSLVTAFLLGRALVRVLSGDRPTPLAEKAVLYSLCVWILTFYFVRFSSGIAEQVFDLNFSAFTASILLYGLCVVVGARYGLAGAINVVGLSLALFIAAKLALLLMNSGYALGEDISGGYRYHLSFTDVSLDNGMRIYARVSLRNLTVLDGIVAPLVYALLGWWVAIRYRVTGRSSTTDTMESHTMNVD